MKTPIFSFGISSAIKNLKILILTSFKLSQISLLVFTKTFGLYWRLFIVLLLFCPFRRETRTKHSHKTKTKYIFRSGPSTLGAVWKGRLLTYWREKGEKKVNFGKGGKGSERIKRRIELNGNGGNFSDLEIWEVI